MADDAEPTSRTRGIVARYQEGLEDPELEQLLREEEDTVQPVPEEDDGHEDKCAVCHLKGELLMCETCPRTFHMTCLKPRLTQVPDGFWSCPSCGDTRCCVTGKGGAYIPCRYCLRRFRADALAMYSWPLPDPEAEDRWHCSECLRATGIEKILAWRQVPLQYPAAHLATIDDKWREASLAGGSDRQNEMEEGCGPPTEPVPAGMEGAVGREYLCKWKGMSYWHCSWVPEPFVRELSAKRVANFLRAQEAASLLPPLAGVDRPATLTEASDDVFLHGIVEPNWLQVHRVLAERKSCLDGRRVQSQFLTKWKGLSYDCCAWELDADLLATANGSKAIDSLRLRTLLGTKVGQVDPVSKRPLVLRADGCTAPDSDHEVTEDELEGAADGCGEAAPGGAEKDGDETESDHESSGSGSSSARGKGKRGAGPFADRVSKKSKNDSPARPPAAKRAKGKGAGNSSPTRATGRFFQLTEQPDVLQGGKLHPYQLEGVNWLRDTWFNGRNVILADEMGLGKTIQTATFIRCIMIEAQTSSPRGGAHGFRPFLVVAPLNTLGNWERELATWCPEMNVVLLAGTGAARETIKQHELVAAKGWTGVAGGAASLPDNGGGGRKKVPKFHVLLTSYEVASLETRVLKDFAWQSMVVDEGHRLKSGKRGCLFQALHTLDTNHRVLLTGTPLQNTMEELFHLLLFLEPKKFHDLDALRAEYSSMDTEEDVEKLRQTLEGHMLRRLKSDVDIKLPDKQELIVPVELVPRQKELYRAILTRNYEVLNKGKKQSVQTSLLNIVMQLKKLCNHALLLDPARQPFHTQDPEAALKQILDESGKLQLLDRMLTKLKANGHRVLIFSQMTMMLDLIEDYIALRQWGYQRLDGNVASRERQQRIDAFNRTSANGNSQHFIFLLSTRAGGQGINLATADTVFIFDADWNPHNDLQALARAHRIGQKHKVMIYRFVTRATVEERIMKIAKQKLLMEYVVQGAAEGRSMNQEELNSVLKYGAEELFAEEEEEQEAKDRQAAADAAAGADGSASTDGAGLPGSTTANDSGESTSASSSPDKPQARKRRRRGALDEPQPAEDEDGSLPTSGVITATQQAKRMAKKMTKPAIVWDDSAIDELLDRDRPHPDEDAKKTDDSVAAGEQDAGGSSTGNGAGMSALLRTFRVAKFTREDEGAAGQDGGQAASPGQDGAAEDDAAAAQDGVDANVQASDTVDWDVLLAHRHAALQEQKQALLGKGKRERRQARILNLGHEVGEDEFEDEMGAGGPDDFGTGRYGLEYGGGGDSDFTDEEADSRRKPKRTRTATIFVDKAGAGFQMSERERVTIQSRLMRFGVRGGDWELVSRLIRQDRQIGARYSYLYSAQGTEEYVKTLLKESHDLVRSQAHLHLPGERAERESVVAKGKLLQRVGILELFARKLKECTEQQAAHATAASDGPNPSQDDLDTSNSSGSGSGSGGGGLGKEGGEPDASGSPAHGKRGSLPIAEGFFTSWSNDVGLSGVWTAEHDQRLIKGVLRYGYGNWMDVGKDVELDLYDDICAEVRAADNRSLGGLANSGGVDLSKYDVGGGGGGSGASAGLHGGGGSLLAQVDPRRVSAWVKKRVLSMEKALMVEAQLQHYQAQLAIDEVQERSTALEQMRENLARWQSSWARSHAAIDEQQGDIHRLLAELDEAMAEMPAEAASCQTKLELMMQRESQSKSAREFCLSTGQLQYLVQSLNPNRDLFEMGTLMHDQYRQALEKIILMTKQAQAQFEVAIRAQLEFEQAQATNLGITPEDLQAALTKSLPPLDGEEDDSCMIIDPPLASTAGDRLPRLPTAEGSVGDPRHDRSEGPGKESQRGWHGDKPSRLGSAASGSGVLNATAQHSAAASSSSSTTAAVAAAAASSSSSGGGSSSSGHRSSGWHGGPEQTL